MKILHLLYDHIDNPWVGGGAAVRAYEIYKRLSREGHLMTVVSGNFKGAKDHKKDGIEYKFVGLKGSYILSTFSYAYFASKFLKENYSKYDVIVEDFAPWNPIFAYRYQDKRVVVLQTHQKNGVNILKKYLIFGLPFYLVERFYPKFFNNVVALSPYTAKEFGFLRYKSIGNGISYIHSENILVGEYALFIGRVDFYQKGLDILLEVFSELGLPLLICGKGKDESKLQRWLKEYKNIKFVGFCLGEKKEKLLKNSRFLVMPSRFEGQGIVALEAAAFGKPVVVSDINILNYVVENEFGVAFKCCNKEDLKRKIMYLWNREDEIIKMGRKGIEYAANFTWDRIADMYENYLKSLL